MKNLNRKNESKIKKGIKQLRKCKTFKNKLYAIALTILGLISAKLLDGDITVLIFMEFIAIPLFFAKENYIVD